MIYSGGFFDISHLPHRPQNVANLRDVDSRTSWKLRPFEPGIDVTDRNFVDSALRRIAPIIDFSHHSGPRLSIRVSKYSTRIIVPSSSAPMNGALTVVSMISPRCPRRVTVRPEIGRRQHLNWEPSLPYQDGAGAA